jgi:hypothetical protein
MWLSSHNLRLYQTTLEGTGLRLRVTLKFITYALVFEVLLLALVLRPRWHHRLLAQPT